MAEYMTVGDKMYAYRKERGITLEIMSKVTGASTHLLTMIEDEGAVTHPNIAARIAAAYKLTLDEYNQIVPKERRSDTLPAPRPPKQEWIGYSAYAESIKGERQ